MTIEAGVPDPEQHPEAGSAGTAREAQALARAGVRLCQQERYAEAVEALRGAAALAPGDALIGNNLAVVLERAGQTEAAIGEQERSLELMLEQPDSWVFLRNLKLKREDWAGAGAAFEAALALRGGDGEPAGPGTAVVGLAWQGLGLVRQKERRLPEAIECFRKCLKLNYVTAPILSILGQLFHETGQFEKARDAYVAALAYDGANPIYRDMRREMDFVCAALREDGEGLNGALAMFLRDQAERPGKEEKSAALLLQSTFALLNVHGHMAAARAVAALRVENFPQSASAAYLLQVMEGTNVPARSPDAYLVEYFDGFAGRFEGHLVETLGYDVPRKLGAALAEFVAAEGRLAVLDAGCGMRDGAVRAARAGVCGAGRSDGGGSFAEDAGAGGGAGALRSAGVPGADGIFGGFAGAVRRGGGGGRADLFRGFGAAGGGAGAGDQAGRMAGDQHGRRAGWRASAAAVGAFRPSSGVCAGGFRGGFCGAGVCGDDDPAGGFATIGGELVCFAAEGSGDHDVKRRGLNGAAWGFSAPRVLRVMLRLSLPNMLGGLSRRWLGSDGVLRAAEHGTRWVATGKSEK